MAAYLSYLDSFGSTSQLALEGLPNGDYYVAIKHYNHLPIISAQAYSLVAGGLYTLDFSEPLSPDYVLAHGTNSMKLETDGMLTMWGGNGDGNCYVNVLDAFIWINTNGSMEGQPTYDMAGDFDNNALVNVLDALVWINANGQMCFVP